MKRCSKTYSTLPLLYVLQRITVISPVHSFPVTITDLAAIAAAGKKKKPTQKNVILINKIKLNDKAKQ